MDWFSQAAETQDASRAAFELMKTIKAYQASMSSLEACRKVSSQHWTSAVPRHPTPPSLRSLLWRWCMEHALVRGWT